MQQDLWFDLAVRGEPDFQVTLLQRLDLAESAGPASEPHASLDDGVAAAEAAPAPIDDLFC
jgi:hypothetical protein